MSFNTVTASDTGRSFVAAVAALPIAAAIFTAFFVAIQAATSATF